MVVGGRSIRDSLAYVGIGDLRRGSSGLLSSGQYICLLKHSEGHYGEVEM